MRQEATFLKIPHKPPDWNIIQDKFKIEELFDGLTELIHLKKKSGARGIEKLPNSFNQCIELIQ